MRLCAAVCLALACGGTPLPAEEQVASCVPACVAKACGDDGCGGSCGSCAQGAACVSGACVAQCVPQCGGKVCGDDGCGGSCGACADGATCEAGVCKTPPPPPPPPPPPTSSPGCPQGGTCKYLERTAWSYACSAPDQCVRAAAISTYGTYEACQTWGCMGGNSRCGDQFGNSDAERWSCEACKVTCNEGALAVCGPARESAQGCTLTDSVWGDYLAACICQ